MGVGHFFGLMPESLLPGCRRTGVELDGITARIAKQLYPDATIFAKGFEETTLPDNFFDAVIGNIPFGNYPVHDPAYRNSPRHADDPRLLPGEVARQAARGRRDGADHQPLHDGQAGFDDPAVSGRPGRSGRRDPAAQHRLQGQRGHGSHDRYSVPAKAGARRRAAAARRGGTWLPSIPRTAPISVNEYFARHPRDDAGRDAARRHDVPRPRADARRASCRRSGWQQAVASLPRRHLRARNTLPRPRPSAAGAATSPTSTARM